jgi:hypothetical protein
MKKVIHGFSHLWLTKNRSFILFLVLGKIAIVNLSKYLYFIFLHQGLYEIIKNIF